MTKSEIKNENNKLKNYFTDEQIAQLKKDYSKGHFFPYVGSRYEEGIEGKKFLSLGDSHYCGGCDNCRDIQRCRWFTQNAVNVFFNNKLDKDKYYVSKDGGSTSFISTYTKFSRILSRDRKLDGEDIICLWERIAFYDFIQNGSTDNASDNFTYEDYKNSVPYFEQVIQKLRPDYILVWGKLLWDTIFKDVLEYGITWPGFDSNEIGYYPVKDENGIIIDKFTCVLIDHPSRCAYQSNMDKIQSLIDNVIRDLGENNE